MPHLKKRLKSRVQKRRGNAIGNSSLLVLLLFFSQILLN